MEDFKRNKSRENGITASTLNTQYNYQFMANLTSSPLPHYPPHLFHLKKLSTSHAFICEYFQYLLFVTFP